MQECVCQEGREVDWRQANLDCPAGAEVAQRYQRVEIEEYLQITRVETELIKEDRDVERNDRPDDERLMRSADVVAKGKQVRLSLWLSPESWERESALTSSRGRAAHSIYSRNIAARSPLLCSFALLDAAWISHQGKELRQDGSGTADGQGRPGACWARALASPADATRLLPAPRSARCLPPWYGACRAAACRRSGAPGAWFGDCPR